jgi:TM2 domain-containing membrane protein YozV
MSNSKSPLLAVILNLLVAGLGHVYLGYTKRGIALFFLSALIAVISSGLGWIVAVLLCSYDAWQLALHRSAPFDFLEKYVGE